MKPLIIGQAPGPRSDPDVPLSGRCGERLAALCGIGHDQFLERFCRVNLIKRFPGKQSKGDAFPIEEARKGAIGLLMTGVFATTKIVLLGDAVARTFGYASFEYKFHKFYPCRVSPHGIAFCPHPSGVNRWWNDAGNFEAARRFWRRLARESDGD